MGFINFVSGSCVIRGCVPKKILVYGAAFGGELEVVDAFLVVINILRFCLCRCGFFT